MAKFHQMKCVSRLFQPTNVVPKNVQVQSELISNSQKLMLDLGIIRSASPGCFHLLPLGMRSLEKLIKLVNAEMDKLGAQQIEMPLLTNAKLWETTGRLQSYGNELFTLTDRHLKKYVLSPTYEEAVTDLVASVSPISHKQLPLRLYQITSKFRDEIKPRFGLLRTRQFDMKDLYTFDMSIDDAHKTYDEVTNSYKNLFNAIGVNFTEVNGSTGDIGGISSHEYHFLASIGEDSLILCDKCGLKSNEELHTTRCVEENCKKTVQPGIEVGHTFLLGEKYSKKLKAEFLKVTGKPAVLQMGCYGLGLTRILAASLEVLSDPKHLRWPLNLVPYKVLLIPPKEGSKEEKQATDLTEQLYYLLNNQSELHNDILIDDRTKFTIGKRLIDAKRLGYPFVIVIGGQSLSNKDDISKPMSAKYEIIDIVEDKSYLLSLDSLISFFKEKFVNK